MILDVGVGEVPRGDVNLDVVKTPYCNIVASAEYLPFRENSFQKVLCSQVLEHLNNPILGLKEINRVLTSNGTAEIDFPKPFFTSNPRYELIAFISNFPFMFIPTYLKRLCRKLIAIRKRSPRHFHKFVITVDSVNKFLRVNEVKEIADIFLSFLISGRKSKYFRHKPKLNSAVMVKCRKR